MIAKLGFEFRIVGTESHGWRAS